MTDLALGRIWVRSRRWAIFSMYCISPWLPAASQSSKAWRYFCSILAGEKPTRSKPSDRAKV